MDNKSISSIFTYMAKLGQRWNIETFKQKKLILYGWSKDVAANILKALGATIIADSEIEKADALVIWGGFFFNEEIINQAIQLSKPIIFAEDGFIRSLFSGQYGERGISFVFDSLGLHFATSVGNSIIVDTLNSNKKFTDQEISDAKNSINLLIENEVTKYNDGNRSINFIGSHSAKKVLVIDQVKGDMSVLLSNVDASVFMQMVEDAIIDNPGADIFIKIHPEQLIGARDGYYPLEYLTYLQETHKNVYILSEPINSIALLKYMSVVYCVSTQMGFEAILCQKKVIIYGCPFYAGWGFSIDKQKIQRNKVRTVEEVFYAAYLEHSIYFSNSENCLINFKQAVDYITAKRNAFSLVHDLFDFQKNIAIQNKNRLIQMELQLKEVSEEKNRVEEAKNKLEEEKARVEEAKNKLEEEKSLVEEAKNKLEEEKNKIESLLTNILASTSWRITCPFRKIRAFFRSFNN